MSTAIIEVKNDIAYSFLYNLERMNLLRIVSRRNELESKEQKLSERFSGSLSGKRTEELQMELKNMRQEWERDTY